MTEIEIHIIAAIAPNGVIGRTNKRCPNPSCEGGSVYHRGAPGAYGLAIDVCAECHGRDHVDANDMPWNYPEDMRHFRDTTTGHAVIAGRKTGESLGVRWPLPKRRCIEVSRQLRTSGDGVIRSTSIENALAAARLYGHERVFVIGGAEVYAATLPLATHLDLTLIGKEYEGDVRFPVEWDYDAMQTNSLPDWLCVERRTGEHPDLTFTKWERR